MEKSPYICLSLDISALQLSLMPRERAPDFQTSNYALYLNAIFDVERSRLSVS